MRQGAPRTDTALPAAALIDAYLTNAQHSTTSGPIPAVRLTQLAHKMNAAAPGSPKTAEKLLPHTFTQAEMCAVWNFSI